LWCSLRSWVYTIDAEGVEGEAFPCFSRSSIFNLLDAAGLTWAYYAVVGWWNAPAALTDSYQSQNIVHNPPQLLKDTAACQLRNVVFVTPAGGYSDHPGGASKGPAWVASIVNALRTNKQCTDGEVYWQNTAIFITWDDWGGWYDHVLPPPCNPPCNTHYSFGFRVPLLVSSAVTPAGYVSDTSFDFGSILRTIEQNFQLPCIGDGEWADCNATDLAEFFIGPEKQYAPIQAPPFVDTEDMSDPDSD